MKGTMRALLALGVAVCLAGSGALAQTAPDAPTIGAPTAGHGQVSVAFTAPVNDGGSAITGYTATSSPGSITGTCAASPCVVTGLTGGTAYTFTVVATNAVGDSVPSSASAAATPTAATVPGAPTIGVVTPGAGQASVAFTAPAANGGRAISRYTATSSPGGLTGTCAASPCVVLGLSAGAYTFTVTATNAIGTGTASAASTSATATAPTVPGAPTGVTATAGNGQASVAFTAPAANGGRAINFYTATSSPGGLTHSCGVSPCVVRGLTNGQAYTFTVTATNAIGTSAASVASAAATPAVAPSIDDGGATLASYTPAAGDACNGGIVFTRTVSLTGFTTGTVNVVTNAACGCPTPGCPTAVVTGTDKAISFNCTYASVSAVPSSLSVVATGTAGNSAETYTLAVERPAWIASPRAGLYAITQVPVRAAPGNLTAPISFNVIFNFTNVTSFDNNTRIMAPANCAVPAGQSQEITEIVPANNDFDGSLYYTCAYPNRLAVPASLTWTVQSALPGCAWNATTPVSIFDATTISMGTVTQQCAASMLSTLNYNVPISVTGATTNLTVPGNCTTMDMLDVYGNGNLNYTCMFDNNASAIGAVLDFRAYGDEWGAVATFTPPTPQVAAQPSVTIGAPMQDLLLPRGIATSARYMIPVTWAGAVSFTVPAGCALNNAANITYPFTGRTVFNCTWAPTMVPAVVSFTANTLANGCFATATKNLTVVYEPLVNISSTMPAQACAASVNAPISYKVNVTYAGSKVAPMVMPTTCVQISAAALNAAGSGTITYQCTFDNAAAVNGTTLNFTAAGLIPGQVQWVSPALPTPVAAVAPTVEVVKGATQSTLLTAKDMVSAVNYTVLVKFGGAVGGIEYDRDHCSHSANETDVALNGGSINFTCTYARPLYVPEDTGLVFKSLTLAADCYAWAKANISVAREPAVSAMIAFVGQDCATDLTAPVPYTVQVYYTGAKKNHTYPKSFCVENGIDLDSDGTGLTNYTCTVKNATLPEPLVFTATGIIAGDMARSDAASLAAAVKAAAPTVTVNQVTQDLLTEGDNTSAVVFTVAVSFTGAEVIAVDPAGACNTTAIPDPVTGAVDLVKSLLVNGTGRISFMCTFTNASVVPGMITFYAAKKAALGCMGSASTDSLVVKYQKAGDVVPYNYQMHFAGMVYADLIANPARLQQFKLDVRTRVSDAVGLDLANVQVGNLSAGSVIAEVVLQTPSGWTPQQVNAAAVTLNDPASVFDKTFLDNYQITGVTVTTLSALPVVKASLSKEAQIGIGVGVGAGGAALVGTVIGVAVARKRRMSVEPRDRMV